MQAAEAVLFATPEFNRSVPGMLKNAIDVGSRPYGKSVWTGKPCAVISVSPGAIGGFGANHHLRQSFVFLDMPAMQQPEAYIGGAAKLFDDSGALTSEPTREFLDQVHAGIRGLGRAQHVGLSIAAARRAIAPRRPRNPVGGSRDAFPASRYLRGGACGYSTSFAASRSKRSRRETSRACRGEIIS